jgi:septal ring factor EnvC (AmiA/AmiB activator)
MVSILEPESPQTEKLASATPAAAPKPAPAKSGAPIWVVIVLILFAGALGWIIFAQVTTTKSVTASVAAQAAPLAEANQKLAKLEARLVSIEGLYAKVKAENELIGEKLGLTQQDIDRTEKMAKKIREEQAAQFGSLSGAVGQVREQLDAQGKIIDETRSQLQRAIGDLGEQSGLIARNHDEVQELKRRGEREYFDFDVKKSKQFDRVGPIAVRLRASDQKRSKFTLTLLADDKEIEKKDKTLLEPVQFYMKGKRTVNEIVVYEITKDRVVGYLSVAKDTK